MMSYLNIEVRDDTEREVVSVGPFPDECKATAVKSACRSDWFDRLEVSAIPEGNVISPETAVQTVLLFESASVVRRLSKENLRYVSSLIQRSYGGFA